VEDPEGAATHDCGFRFLCGCHGGVGGQRGKGIQLGLEGVDAREHGARHLDGRDVLSRDPLTQ